jgi:hypothetical protein
MNKTWVIEPPDARAKALASELRIHPLLVSILLRRGLTNAADMLRFMNPALETLEDPFAYRDMRKAVDRVRRAIADKEKIIVYGDYDVDGVTGSAILYPVLKKLGADVDVHIPHRMKDGYGLNLETLKELHKPLEAKFVVMRPESAQMCKYSANAYLATRITFINQIANLCEVNGANILEVIEGIGLDKRIGSHYWYPGFGYGGSCFPKDVKELAAYAKEVKEDGNLMVKISELNEERIPHLMKKYAEMVDGWSGKKVAVLGLSFKKNTDDMREAPATKVIPILSQAGAVVSAYDPMAIATSKAWFPDWKVAYAQTPLETLKDADAVFVLVEWPELTSLPVKDIVAAVKPKALFVDARNQYAGKRKELEESGLRYVGVGVA